MTAKELADIVVTALFSNGGQRADRLVLTVDTPQVHDIGAMTREGASQAIVTILRSTGVMVATVLLCLVLAPAALAQPVALDRVAAPFPTAAERRAADVVSWGTVLTSLTIDGTHTWQSCRAERDACQRTLALAGVRALTTFGATTALKALIRRRRPCAPSCGADNPDYSFPSGHTAWAFAAMGGGRVSVMLPLAIGSGGLRVAAGKHYLTDVLAGAGIGLAVSRIR